MATKGTWADIAGVVCSIHLLHEAGGWHYTVYRLDGPAARTVCTGWTAGTKDEARKEAREHAARVLAAKE